MTNIEPKFGALADSRIDSPETPNVCSTPGDRPGQLVESMAIDDGSGALDRRALGQLHVRQQVALVLVGNEAGRHVGETPPGQQPAGRHRAIKAMTLPRSSRPTPRV